jgi:flagellar motor switch protein FliN
VATIDKVPLDIAVLLGTTAMPVHQVLRLGRGASIELDAREDEEVTILANNMPVAKGTVVVSGNRIAIEVRELMPRSPDMRRRGSSYQASVIRQPGAGCFLIF